MEQKKVKTKGTLHDMAQFTELSEETIQGAIKKVENTANIEVEIPNEGQ